VQEEGWGRGGGSSRDTLLNREVRCMYGAVLQWAGGGVE